MSKRCLVPLVFGVASLAAVPGLAQELPPPSLAPAEAGVAKEDDDASKVPLDEIRRYVSVYNAVKQAYVEPVNDQKLMHSAIRGLLFDLDPHSVYLDKSDAENFEEQSRSNSTPMPS